MPKLPQAPKPEEQIRPDALVRTIKNEKPATTDKLKDIAPTPENYRKFKGGGPSRAPLPHGLIWGIVGIVVLFVIGSVVSFYVAKEKVKQSIAAQATALQAGVADLQNFDTQSAAAEFSSLASSTSTPTIESVLGIFGSLFSGGKNAVSAFGDLANQLAMLSNEASGLGDSVFNFAVSAGAGVGSGTNATSTAVSATSSAPAPAAPALDLVSQLTDVRNTLVAIDNDSSQLSGALSAVGAQAELAGPSSTSYLPLKAQVESAENFLNAFIPWLATSTPHNVLVMLQNPSEMRPGGGFLGSYADVTIASGTITNISVHDIADVDTGFPLKTIPPAPLQLEVANFRPADANWFLDFPTSASETISMFEASKLYGGASSTAENFDAAIALSPKVISDLLSITGPITVSKTTFTSDNLLTQIQNIVQQGQAKSAGETAASETTYPKAILSTLSQNIFTQLAASSTDAQKQELFAMALDWVAKRDVMAYFTNPTLEGFAQTYGAGGDIFQLPQSFNGDYLAVADTNINGDKSDLYVAQNVSWDAQIGADGTITDTLKISRAHNGNQSKNWWYQTSNQDYLQVFVPNGAALTNEVGGIVKTIVPEMSAAQYARDDYSTDPLVAAIASTTQSFLLYPAVTAHQDAGKTVFTTWVLTHAGQTSSLEFDYTHRAFIPPADGVAYQFVFEKQAGFPVSAADISGAGGGVAGGVGAAASAPSLDDHNYTFEIDAPLGYVFAETGLATYEYTSDDPPGRLVVNLTLEKV